MGRRIQIHQDLLSIQILQAFTYCLGFGAIAGAGWLRSAAFDSSIDFSGEVFEGSCFRSSDGLMSLLTPELCNGRGFRSDR